MTSGLIDFKVINIFKSTIKVWIHIPKFSELINFNNAVVSCFCFYKLN
jgi:hypothetical protein